jgi:hypothetical protein
MFLGGFGCPYIDQTMGGEGRQSCGLKKTGMGYYPIGSDHVTGEYKL